MNCTFICYPRCSTCKKAETWLESNDISFEYRDIKLDNPGYEELKQWHEKSGLPLKKFFNTSGLIYKEKSLKDKLPLMSEEEQLHLLASNGLLVKRPLLITDDTVLVGFREPEWSQALGR